MLAAKYSDQPMHWYRHIKALVDRPTNSATNVTRNICDNTKFLLKDFVCVEVLRPSQPNGVMSSAVSLPNHTFTGQA